MVLIKKIHNRGSTTVVEAHGEILFAATGDVGQWTRRFIRTLEQATKAEAPRNKRPRWAHYGKPLKQTFDSDVAYRPNRMRVYGAVGSSAPHAAFVDQGTGVFGGRGAYEAKILPPWRRGSASLYEKGWSPNGWGDGSTVMIQGQKGQFFFDAGLKRAFAAMRMFSFEAPSTPQIEDAVRSLPPGILSFLDQGNTVANPAFKAQLEEWRAWRQEAFNEGRTLGQRKGRVNSRPGRRYVKRPKRRRTAADKQREREMAAARSARYRDRKRAENRQETAATPTKRKKRTLTEREKQRLDLARQAKVAKERQRQRAKAEREARQRIRARIARRNADAFLKLKQSRGKAGTKISLSSISENGVIVGYVVTVTSPSGKRTRREFT